VIRTDIGGKGSPIFIAIIEDGYQEQGGPEPQGG